MYKTKYPHLAQPLKLGHSGITLKNRINSAPQWNFMATYDNHITRECVEAVIPFAKGGSAVVAMGRVSSTRSFLQPAIMFPV